MPEIYWIEDGFEFLEGTLHRFRLVGASVHQFSTTAEFVQGVNFLTSTPGAILVDLDIPSGTNEVELKDHNEFNGFSLLVSLKDLDRSKWPLFVLSGNLSVSIIDRLIDSLLIPRESIFAKPLVERDTFVDRVIAAAAHAEKTK